VLTSNKGIIAELDTYYLRKSPSDFWNPKDETGEIIREKRDVHCGSLRPGLVAVRHYLSN